MFPWGSTPAKMLKGTAIQYTVYYIEYILDVRKIGHLNIKTKMLDIEARVLIGRYSLASQSERVPTRCIEYNIEYKLYTSGRILYVNVLIRSNQMEH